MKNAKAYEEEIAALKAIIAKQDAESADLRQVLAENTKLRQFNESLQVHLETVVDSIPGSHWWKDLSGRYQGCNDVVAKLLGFTSAKEIIGKTDYELPWANTADELIAHDKFVVDSGTSHTREERVADTQGNDLTFLVAKAPLRDYSGKIVGTIGTSFNITELKNTQKQLEVAKNKAETANAAKTEFIANISHDFVTALTSILGVTQILKDKDLERSVMLSYLDDVEKAGSNLLQLINDIITFTKSDHGIESIRKDVIDFSKMADDMYAMLHHKAAQKGLKFQIAVDSKYKIISDKNRLTRILMNLAGNAIKFTDIGKVSLFITVEKKNATDALLHIEIKDTGIGIPEDKQADIFERFSRIDPSYKGHESGAGLGLSIAKRFVQDLKGTITLESRPDQGTTFKVDLPCHLVSISSSLTPDAIASPELVTQHIANVLLVEDNPIIQKVTSQFLKDLGCQVVCAGTATEALVKLNTTYDLVLLDIGLPDHDGLYVVREIRKLSNAKLNNIPVVAHTAHLKDEDRQQALDAGMNDFLTKPTNKAILSQMLSRFVSKVKEPR